MFQAKHISIWLCVETKRSNESKACSYMVLNMINAHLFRLLMA